ncbi:hypothetical protein E2C01_056878 [Portunus trituberculatus]|uniref:Uncharacterized protein n=1 Tax=Portunus trituberculatus TaxID=210409 RepID=A0A5B7GYX4_PORTR|nr:hypothetical protein [Portunus trituberculatus]
MPRGPVMSTITVGAIEKLPEFVADMDESCLVGLDSLVQNAVCVDSRRMKMQVCEVADATVRACGRQAAVSSCGGDVADNTGTPHGRQAAASSDGCEVDGDTGEASSALSPHVVDLEVCNSTKLTPEQVVKLKKRLMEHKDVFNRGAQDLGCTSLVQPSNTADSQPVKQPHSSVLLAKREEMRLPLDLATGQPPEEELPQTAHELVVTLQQRMEVMRRQVVNNHCLAGQAMTHWYQLRAGDGQYAVGTAAGAVTYKLEIATSKQRHIVHIDRLWAVVEEGCLWGQQGPPSLPDK